MDVSGPMKNVTLGGCRYYLTVIDDYSRYTTVFFLREKSDVVEKLKHFVTEVEATFGRLPKVIRSDYGRKASDSGSLHHTPQKPHAE